MASDQGLVKDKMGQTNEEGQIEEKPDPKEKEQEQNEEAKVEDVVQNVEQTSPKDQEEQTVEQTSPQVQEKAQPDFSPTRGHQKSKEKKEEQPDFSSTSDQPEYNEDVVEQPGEQTNPKSEAIEEGVILVSLPTKCMELPIKQLCRGASFTLVSYKEIGNLLEEHPFIIAWRINSKLGSNIENGNNGKEQPDFSSTRDQQESKEEEVEQTGEQTNPKVEEVVQNVEQSSPKNQEEEQPDFSSTGDQPEFNEEEEEQPDFSSTSDQPEYNEEEVKQTGEQTNPKVEEVVQNVEQTSPKLQVKGLPWTKWRPFSTNKGQNSKLRLQSKPIKVQVLVPIETATTKDFSYTIQDLIKDTSFKVKRCSGIRNLCDSSPLAVVCPIISRFEPDIDCAIDGIKWRKTYVVLLLHSGLESSLPRLPTASKLGHKEKYKNIIFIDIAYTIDKKLYQCQMNEIAKAHLKSFLQNFTETNQD